LNHRHDPGPGHLPLLRGGPAHQPLEEPPLRRGQHHRKPAAPATSCHHPSLSTGQPRRLAEQGAYARQHTTPGEVLPLCRLRYSGSASLWGFAIYLASRDGYEDSVLPSGLPIGEPEEALDCACGLYRNDPNAWQEHLPPANP